MNKISYLCGDSDKPLLGETIGQNLRRTVETFPNSIALICKHQNYRATYQDFWDDTTKVAKALIAAGVVNGDRVGIWAMNCYEWVLLQYATARIGAILVNINPAYKTSELEYLLNQAGVKLVVSAIQFKSSNYVAIMDEVLPKAPSLQKVVYLNRDWEDFTANASLVSDETLDGFESLVQFDDPVNIQYTSGTTGYPKGVTLSHHNLLNNGYFIGERLHYTEKDNVCIPVPFYHCFGMVIGNLCCTSHGATMVVPSEHFLPEETLKAISEERCTSVYGVPTMFIAELELPNFSDYDLTSLRTGVMAGSPCPEEIMRKVQDLMHMTEVTICYGMTETSPVSTQTKIGAPLDKQVKTVGTIQSHLEIKIVNPRTGMIVPVGEKGELCTRGYSVMLKYWNNAEATDRVIDDGRWMHSGDEAFIDENGYITVTGRIKDIIIRGGENISPLEVEQFLYTHPAVSDVQVIGVPDAKFGEAVMAWIKLKDGQTLTEAELIDFCKSRIAYYKVPKYWKFVDAFPMTISGKVRKIDMRKISMEELNLFNIATTK